MKATFNSLWDLSAGMVEVWSLIIVSPTEAWLMAAWDSKQDFALILFKTQMLTAAVLLRPGSTFTETTSLARWRLKASYDCCSQHSCRGVIFWMRYETQIPAALTETKVPMVLFWRGTGILAINQHPEKALHLIIVTLLLAGGYWTQTGWWIPYITMVALLQ